MGTKRVTASSKVSFAQAFDEVFHEYQVGNIPVDFTVVGWTAQAGGVVGPLYSVEVDVSARHIE